MLIVNSIVKLPELVPVPHELVMLIGPVVAPAGTVVVICVSPLTVKLATLVPLNFTVVEPVNRIPFIVTLAPTRPLVGVKLVMMGTFAAKFAVSVLYVLITSPMGLAALAESPFQSTKR